MANQPNESPAEPGIILRKVEYYVEVRPPTLRQFLHRRHLAHVMRQIKGQGAGVVLDPEKNLPAPTSAMWAREQTRGVTSEQLERDHPEWVQEYRERYG